MQLRAVSLSVVAVVAHLTAVDTVLSQSVTRLHPDGATFSIPTMIRHQQISGRVVTAGVDRAIIWDMSVGSVIDLHPNGSIESNVLATDGQMQVGYVRLQNSAMRRAAVWMGTTSSMVDLHPYFGTSSSQLLAMSDGIAVGLISVGSSSHAFAMNMSDYSWVDLNPVGASASVVQDTHRGNHAGASVFDGLYRASVWSGDSHGWTNLHPAGAVWSRASAVFEDRQGGLVHSGVAAHAALWQGSADEWIDLHPAGASDSSVRAMYERYQAGFAKVAGADHAGLWTGSADSWFDLHSLLPLEFSTSLATDVWADEGQVYVIGYGASSVSGRHEALLWTLPIPAPASVALGVFAGLAAGRRRRG